MFDDEGQPERMIGAHTDVTSLMQTKMELEKATSQLARSNEELSSFAYAASHDLKAPLRSIKQLATWIEEDVPSISEDTAENFALLQHRVSRMEDLLDSLLEYSRLEHGAKQAPESIDVGFLVNELFSFLSPPSTFNLIIEGELPTIEAIKTPLEQVLRNLLGNAIKHRIHDSGLVAVWHTVEQEYFHFYIGDDGTDIPDEFHNKIFEMFQTLKPKDQVEGSGMGLAMVKKIIQQHGGEVGVISKRKADQATTLPHGCSKAFFFTWPKQTKLA